MDELPIFICRRGSVSKASLRALQKAGVIVVQADDPSECKFFRASQEVSGGELLWAAMKALHSEPQERGKNATTATFQREKMIEFIMTLLESQREKRTTPATSREEVSTEGHAMSSSASAAP